MKQFIILTGLLIILLISAILFYHAHVAGNHISPNTSDWANFSTYLYFVVAFFNVLVFILLTTQVFRYNQIKDRPIISFLTSEHQGYFICNVGQGSAINCKIKTHFEEGKWLHAYKLHHIISRSDNEPLIWTKGAKTICTRYSDLSGNEYISYMVEDKLTVIDLSRKFHNRGKRKIIKTWNIGTNDFKHRPWKPEA